MLYSSRMVLMSGSAMISRSTLQSQLSVELAKQRNVLEKLQNYATYASTEVTALKISNTVNDIKTDVQEIVQKLGDITGINGEEGTARNIVRLKAMGWTEDANGELHPPKVKISLSDLKPNPIWTKSGREAWKKSRKD